MDFPVPLDQLMFLSAQKNLVILAAATVSVHLDRVVCIVVPITTRTVAQVVAKVVIGMAFAMMTLVLFVPATASVRPDHAHQAPHGILETRIVAQLVANIVISMVIAILAQKIITKKTINALHVLLV